MRTFCMASGVTLAVVWGMIMAYGLDFDYCGGPRGIQQHRVRLIGKIVEAVPLSLGDVVMHSCEVALARLRRKEQGYMIGR